MYQVSHMHYSSLMTNSNVEKLLHSKPKNLQIPTLVPYWAALILHVRG